MSCCGTCQADTDCAQRVCLDDDNHLPCPHGYAICPEHCLRDHEGEADDAPHAA